MWSTVEIDDPNCMNVERMVSTVLNDSVWKLDVNNKAMRGKYGINSSGIEV